MPKLKGRDWIVAITAKFRLSFGGSIGGILFFCFSFTPSLLPRGYITQGLAAGLSFATGYGLAVAVAHLYHKLPRRYQLSIPPLAKRVTIVLLLLLAVVFIIAGYNWQQDIRTLTQASSESYFYPVRVVIVAAILSALLIWAGRGARRLSRYCARKFNHFLGPTLSMYLGRALAIVIIVFLVNGVLLRSAFAFINYSFGLQNKGTSPGIYQPQSSEFSGSPTSAINWNGLGEKGREFVASAPTAVSIHAYSGTDSQQPSRLYAGLESAPTLQERVQLLVQELNRTKAGNRKAVLIAIPTGSGGINAKSVQSVEYLFNGDTTTLGIQYSYLPSWLSFLADQETARQNGQVLTEAVYDWWSNLPADNRPKLLMYGESLGTLGADGAFSGPSDMANRMSGVLLAGPPNANHLWSEIVAGRDMGSREVLPTYQNGKVVRFNDGTFRFATKPTNQTWGTSRIGFIQHASDPVVWGSLALFLHQPDWLKEPRGSDVLPNMRWYPFVTGWQMALDLPFAFGATPGHGHRYDNSLTGGWEDILNIHPSPEKSQQLQDIVNQLRS